MTIRNYANRENRNAILWEVFNILFKRYKISLFKGGDNIPKRMNLVGQKFGRLTVKEFYDVKHGMSRWICDCDCGNTNVIVYGNHIKSGNTISCGCYYKESRNKVGYKHGGSKDRLYQIWADMKDRCNNKNSVSYHWYGGKGIIVCDEWKNDYAAFKEWALANGYDDSLTIDRIDSNKNYCPENCQWITLKENINKSKRQYSGSAFNTLTKQIIYFSSLSEFAKLFGYNQHSVQTACKKN